MKRRRLLAVFSALFLAPLARAQTTRKPHRIGFLPDHNETWRGWFVAEMGQRGWSEGRDYVIVQGGVPFDVRNASAAAKRVVAENPDLIVVQTTAYASAAHRLTSSIPIVMWVSGYPVEVGLANSLGRPGKNVTGNSIYAGAAVWGKMVELLRDTKPRIKHIGVLWGYSPPAFLREEIEPGHREIRQTAQAFGIAAEIDEYASPEEVPGVIASLDRSRPDALIIAGRTPLGGHAQSVMQYAEQKRLPTIADSLWPPTNERDPLLTFGVSWEGMMRQAAYYVDRILKGARPGDLPIQQPTRFELVVNRKTAKAIGLTLPQSLLLRADRVIE